MDRTHSKSCWGVTAWAILGFAGVVGLVLLLGVGAEGALVATRG